MLEIGILLFFLALGFFVGGYIESRHYASIRKREQQNLSLPTTSSKKFDNSRNIAEARLVVGNTVVAIDYFKLFSGTIRSLIGGRIGAYETLIDRARREAVLRMQEESRGFDLIVNTRIETSSIGGGTATRKSTASIEAFAYGTAIKFRT